MTTRKHDTRPAHLGSEDTQLDSGAQDTARARRTTEPGDDSLSAAEPGAPRYRSEVEPMDVILKRIGRSRVNVPNSLEPGVARQAVHAPVAPYRPAGPEGGVFVEPTRPPVPAPVPASEAGERKAKTVLGRPPLVPWARIGVAVAAASALVVIVYLLFLRLSGKSEDKEAAGAKTPPAVEIEPPRLPPAAFAEPAASERIEIVPSLRAGAPTDNARRSPPSEPTVAPTPPRTHVARAEPNDPDSKAANGHRLKDYEP